MEMRVIFPGHTPTRLHVAPLAVDGGGGGGVTACAKEQCDLDFFLMLEMESLFPASVSRRDTCVGLFMRVFTCAFMLLCVSVLATLTPDTKWLFSCRLARVSTAGQTPALRF